MLVYVYARGKSHSRLHIIRKPQVSVHERKPLVWSKHIARTTRGLQHSTSLKGVCQALSTVLGVCTSKVSCDTRLNVKDIREKHNTKPQDSGEEGDLRRGGGPQERMGCELVLW